MTTNPYPRLTATLLALGFALCAILLSTPAQAGGTSYRADEVDRANHREHLDRSYAWEKSTGRRRSAELVAAITARGPGNFHTHPARVKYILDLEDEINELLALTSERQRVISAGFCSEEDAMESSAFEALDIMLSHVTGLRDEIALLTSYYYAMATRSIRHAIERVVLYKFFFGMPGYPAVHDQWVREAMDTEFTLLTSPLTENESCRSYYGTDAFDHMTWTFYSPHGW